MIAFYVAGMTPGAFWTTCAFIVLGLILIWIKGREPKRPTDRTLDELDDQIGETHPFLKRKRDE